MWGERHPAFKGAGNVCVIWSGVSTAERGALGSFQPGLLQVREDCLWTQQGTGGTGNCCRELVSSQKINQVFWALSCWSYLELFILLAYSGFHFNCTVTFLFRLVVAQDYSDCTGLEKKQTICTQVTGVSRSASFVLDWRLGFGLGIFSCNKLLLPGFPQLALPSRNTESG